MSHPPIPPIPLRLLGSVTNDAARDLILENWGAIFESAVSDIRKHSEKIVKISGLSMNDAETTAHAVAEIISSLHRAAY